MQSLVEEGNGEPPRFSQVRLKLGLSTKEMAPSTYIAIGRVLTLLGWRGRQNMRKGVRDTFYTLQ
jgi:hypothetical protein